MAIPTIAETPNVAKSSQRLAGDEVAKGKLFHGFADNTLPVKIYMERKAVQWKYTYDAGNVTDLQQTTSYLLDLCGKYIAQSQYLISGGIGGTVIGGSPITVIGGSSSSGEGAFSGNL